MPSSAAKSKCWSRPTWRLRPRHHRFAVRDQLRPALQRRRLCAPDRPHRPRRGVALSVYSYKDERLLVDIEKLIKQTITRGELVGFNPAPARPPRDTAERSAAPRPRRPEGETAERPARPERIDSSERGERYGRSSGPLPRREKVDPWFLKPYEPAVSAAPAAPAIASSSKPGKQKIAALLGGIPKQSV
jgi:ATP-dependent RNA helicase RhlE